MTAAQGRCAGCAATGPVREAIRHITQCPAWARLYQENPAQALEPAAEYARWVAQDKDREHAEDLQSRVDDTVRRRRASVARFTEPDLLGADDEHDRTVA